MNSSNIPIRIDSRNEGFLSSSFTRTVYSEVVQLELKRSDDPLSHEALPHEVLKEIFLQFHMRVKFLLSRVERLCQEVCCGQSDDILHLLLTLRRWRVTLNRRSSNAQHLFAVVFYHY